MKILASLLIFAASALAKPTLQRIGDDFKRPIFVTSRPDDASKLFIVEQQGKIFIYDQSNGKTLKKPFLDISKQVSRKGNEEGLLGFAFAPNYKETGHFYVNFSNKDQTNEIARFTVSEDKPLVCDPDTKEILLTYKQPFRNHNGGYLEFGPDGYLYIGTGDGGKANDPEHNAQDLTNLLGKILRIDVSGSGNYTIPANNPFVGKKDTRPEILAYGLRNPWRCSWDKDVLYIADVGQNAWEEINAVTSDQLSGANFGWRPREGLIATPKDGVGGPSPKPAIEPVHVYSHGAKTDQGQSVNGGYVYRGSVTSLQGQYLYSDHINPRIWSFEFRGSKATNHQDLTKVLARPDGEPWVRLCSFGQDSDNELYILDMAGSVWKIVSQ